jgi:hypothetical protein
LVSKASTLFAVIGSEIDITGPSRGSIVLAHRLALVLLAVSALVAVLGPVWEARQRAPEAAVRAYLAAVEREDLAGALRAVAPGERDELRERVELQLGSRYRVNVLALATPPLLARLLGTPATTAQATILAEVTPVSGERWKSTTVVDLILQDGTWYLIDAPFA